MKRWPLHAGFWLAYLLFEAYVEFGWIGPSFSHLSASERFWLSLQSEATLMPVKMALVYFLFFLFFPSSEKTRPMGLTIPLSLVGFAAAVVMRRLVLVYVSIPRVFRITDEPPQAIFELTLLNSSFIELLFISGVAVSIKAFRLRTRWREREKNLINEKLESELKFLKTQINPHFLFNTLNNIYALARKQSERTPEAVLKLSKLMRFMLYEASKKHILLVEEIRIINDYLELERMRYNGRLNIVFKHELDDDSQTIAPLLIIHFVENAFKHGASEARFEAKILISVKLEKGMLTTEIVNTKEEPGATDDREKIGLRNIRRQLELLYPAHHLEIKEGPLDYAVRLTLPLTNQP